MAEILYEITQFGGIRCDADPEDLSPGYVSYSENVSTDKKGSLRTRRGNELLGDIGTYTSFISGLGSRIKSDGQIEYLRAVDYKIQYLPTSGIWTDRVTTRRNFASSTATAGTTNVTIVTTDAIFTSSFTVDLGASVGCYVYNRAKKERRRITAYTNTTTVTVDRDVTTWLGDAIWLYEETGFADYNNYSIMTPSSQTAYTIYMNETDGPYTLCSIPGARLVAVAKGKFGVAGFMGRRNLVVFNYGNISDGRQSLTIESANGVFDANADVDGANTLKVASWTAGLRRTSFDTGAKGALIFNTTLNAWARVVSYKSATTVLTDTDTSTWDGDSFVIVENYFETDHEIISMIGVGNYMAVFDRTNLYLVDANNYTSRTYLGLGTNVRYAAATDDDNNLFFFCNKGIMLLPEGGSPTNIGELISNPLEEDGLYDLIDRTKPHFINAGYAGDNFLLSVGDLEASFLGQQTSHTVLEFDMKHFREGTPCWRASRYKSGIYHTTFNEDGKRVTLVGLSGKPLTLKLEAVEQDYDPDNQAYDDINNKIVINDLVYSASQYTKDIKSVAIRYKSEDLVSVFFSREYEDYSVLADATLPIAENYETVIIPYGFAVNTHGLKITWRGRGEISSIKFYGSVRNSDRSPS